MPHGLQVFNANGTVRLDSTRRISRVVGNVIIDTATQSGTYVNAAFTTGTPAGIFIPSGITTMVYNVGFYFSGNTLYWSKTGYPGNTAGTIITFVY